VPDRNNAANESGQQQSLETQADELNGSQLGENPHSKNAAQDKQT